MKQYILTVGDDQSVSISPLATEPPVEPMPEKLHLGTNLESLRSWMVDRPLVNHLPLSVWQFYAASDWLNPTVLPIGDESASVPVWGATRRMLFDGSKYEHGIYELTFNELGPSFIVKGASWQQASPGVILLHCTGGNIWIEAANGKTPELHSFHLQMESTGNFRKKFLAEVKRYRVIRFMDWLETNGDGSRPEDQIRAPRNFQIATQLAQEADVNAWFCVHAKDDVAEYRSIPSYSFLEHSNEVWNGQFPQAKGRTWDEKVKWHASRTKEIHQLTQQIDCYSVLGSQAYNSDVADQLLKECKRIGFTPDYLAIAPYFGYKKADRGTWNEAVQLDSNLAYFDKDSSGISEVDRSIDFALEVIEENKRIAEAHGTEIALYEAGQHFLGAGSVAMNADARMGDAYRRYYKGIERILGTNAVVCNFAKTGGWNQHGSWGEVQEYGVETEKSKAIAEFLP